MENSYTNTNSPSILHKVAAFFVTAATIGLVLMFSVLLLTALLTIGAMAWCYLWWKSRHLRKQMRGRTAGDEAIKGEVIEGEIIDGEVIRVTDSGER